VARDLLECLVPGCSYADPHGRHFHHCYECRSQYRKKWDDPEVTSCPECGWAGDQNRVFDYPSCPRHPDHKLVPNYSARGTLNTETFERFYSSSQHRWFETAGEYKGWVKQMEGKGYHVGPDRADDKPQNKVHQRVADDIAKFGPAAEDYHSKKSSEGKRKDQEEKNPDGV
jgi:hypothetical protein